MGKRKKMTIFLLAQLMDGAAAQIGDNAYDSRRCKAEKSKCGQVFEKGTELHDSCIQSHQ